MPLNPRDAAIYLDLSEIEGFSDAEFYLDATPEEELSGPDPYPAGIVVGTERRHHGADVHLTWEQARQVRDVLTRLLHEAGEE